MNRVTANVVCPMLLALVTLVAGGCGRSVPNTSNPIAIGTNEYDRVFDATVDLLREQRWIVDRKDRRFGVVTTEPRTAASVFEPWYADNTTSGQVAESTLNHQRRTIRVEIQPLKAPDASGAITDRYQLFVQVNMDRRHHPPRTLNTAVVRSVSFHESGGRGRPVMTEAGYQQSFWEPIGRDELLERRLVAAILNRAVGYQPPPAPEAETPDAAPEAQPAEPPADATSAVDAAARPARS